MGLMQDRIVEESSNTKDHRGRIILTAMLVLIVLLLAVSVTAGILSWKSYRSSAEDGTGLAQQVIQACETDSLDVELRKLCPQADDVVEQAPSSIKGDPGPQGNPGPSGPSGATGSPGPIGTAGQIGPRGPRGVDGSPGPIGETGAAGASGKDGANGTTGAQGPVGPKGDTGAQGPAGANGADGANGQDGATGAQGPPGVIDSNDQCPPAPDGQVIEDIGVEVDPVTQTLTVICTYKPDQTGLLPTNP